MYHAILQVIDVQIEVVYPIPYIANSIPKQHPSREGTLQVCRQLLLDEDYWVQLCESSLFYHPRR